MHVSPAKHSSGKCDRKVWQTDRQTDGQTTDKVIPMCRYASQATQKIKVKIKFKLIDQAIRSRSPGSKLWYGKRGLVTKFKDLKLFISHMPWALGTGVTVNRVVFLCHYSWCYKIIHEIYFKPSIGYTIHDTLPWWWSTDTSSGSMSLAFLNQSSAAAMSFYNVHQISSSLQEYNKLVGWLVVV